MIHDRIETNPKIMFGKPVIKGTRITVELILRKLGGGMTVSEIRHGSLTMVIGEMYLYNLNECCTCQ